MLLEVKLIALGYALQKSFKYVERTASVENHMMSR